VGLVHTAAAGPVERSIGGGTQEQQALCTGWPRTSETGCYPAAAGGVYGELLSWRYANERAAAT